MPLQGSTLQQGRTLQLKDRAKCYNKVMEDSVFTKIVKGEIPCHKVYEDDKTLAFLDIHPSSSGQVVVVPKVQANFVWDLSPEDYQALMLTVQKVGRRLREVFPNKKRIGVSIEGLDIDNHAHVVLFPFDTAAELHATADMSAEPDHSALSAQAERLRF
jgi:histidine triad (HIT) family protein